MKIKAKMTVERRTEDWIDRIPVVTESDHSRFTVGTRFDWGFVQVALDQGYAIEIEPDDVNASNCAHDKGFQKSGISSTCGQIYICPICKETKYKCPTCHELRIAQGGK